MKITTNFSKVEAMGVSAKLTPGIYDAKIYSVFIGDSFGRQRLSIGVSALESAGEQVGSTANVTAYLYDKGADNKDDTSKFSNRFLGVIKAAGISAGINVLEAQEDVTFDTDELKDKIVIVKVGEKKPWKNDKGETITGIEIKEFLPEGSEVTGAKELHELDSTFASGDDPLDEEKEEVKKPAPKKPAPKKEVKKETKVEETKPSEDESKDESKDKSEDVSEDELDDILDNL